MRRFFLISLIVSVFFGFVGSVQAGDRPNIVYILADDLGWGDLSLYGQKHFETPNIDRGKATELKTQKLRK